MKSRITVQGFRRGREPGAKEILARARAAENIKRGDMVSGKVYKVIEDGAFILTPENYIGFFHCSEQTKPLQVGDLVEGRVTFVRPDGRLNLSMRPLKEVGRVTDAEKILTYLRQRGGQMPYSDETPPEIIRDKFNLSKGAFKRALGKLLKEGLISQGEGWTYLTREGRQEG